LSDLAK